MKTFPVPYPESDKEVDERTGFVNVKVHTKRLAFKKAPEHVSEQAILEEWHIEDAIRHCTTQTYWTQFAEALEPIPILPFKRIICHF